MSNKEQNHERSVATDDQSELQKPETKETNFLESKEEAGMKDDEKIL